MKFLVQFRFVSVTLIFVFGMIFLSCSDGKVVLSEQEQRLDMYVNSGNGYIAGMFIDESMLHFVKQPALTHKELCILDALVDRIAPEVRDEFDQKYTAWLVCWTPYFSIDEKNADLRQSLKCNGEEFRELIEFCRRQNEDVFLLLYQLAVRAHCPYDGLLLHPAYELLDDFPEFSKYWQDVDLSLKRKKPHIRNRTCNEFTIWHVRKVLETKYGYSYTNGLAAMFDTHKMILMAQ